MLELAIGALIKFYQAREYWKRGLRLFEGGRLSRLPIFFGLKMALSLFLINPNCNISNYFLCILKRSQDVSELPVKNVFYFFNRTVTTMRLTLRNVLHTVKMKASSNGCLSRKWEQTRTITNIETNSETKIIDTNNVDVILTLSYGDDDGTILGDSG